ncbi:MAG: flagellar biosynthetic protein FliO [Actinomycetota bacterium]
MSTVELSIRMVVALVVIGVLLYALNRLTRRILDGRGGSRPVLAVRHQQRIDRHASVTLLTAGGRNLLIGTTNQSIVLLAEGDDLGAPPSTGAASLDAGPGAGPTTNGTGATAGGGRGAGTAAIDVRTRSGRNPIRALQNKTVRRS